MLPRTIKAALAGVALGFALSQMVQHLSLEATLAQHRSAGDAPTFDSKVIAFTNLRRQVALDYDSDGYYIEDTFSATVLPPHPNSDQDLPWKEYATILGQRRGVAELRPDDPSARRRVLLSAVITSIPRIKEGHTLALHDTWGKEAPHHVYFAERNAAPPPLPPGMNLVQMDLLDSADTWEEKEMAVVRHLGALHCDRTREAGPTDRYDWFLVAGDEVYVVSAALESKLNQLDAALPICLGAFKDEGTARFGVVVYSWGLMKDINVCLTSIPDSVKTCVTRLGALCLEGKETGGWVHMGAQTHAAPLDVTSMLRAAVIYPVGSAAQLYVVHASLKQLQYNVSAALAREAVEAINSIMPRLPPEHRFTVPPVLDGTLKSMPTSSCVVTPAAGYVPKGRYDIGFWEYFNQTRLMGVWRDSPCSGIVGDVREEARFVLSKAIHIVNQLQQDGDKLVFDSLENGYRRVDATRGSEYVIDLVFRGGASAPHAPIRKRVSLLRPYHSDLVPMPSLETPSAINMIVVLSGFSDRLERFLQSYEEQLLTAGSKDVSLTVVLYESPDSHSAREVLQRCADRHPSSRISVVDGVGEFARGVGLHLASERFPGDQLLFFVDVDLNISAPAVRRCRLNAVRGRQVYFPVFFKTYNMSFVGRHFRGETRHLIARHNGHWAHYSYGTVCIYADDYRKAGGFELAAKGWGNEDVDFLERTLKAGLEPFRSPDPGLVHNWHPKICDRGTIADNRTYEDCMRSRGEDLADRIELANYVLGV